MTGWIANEFKGLTPAVEPRRSDQVFALSGKNYLFDSIGPKSAFGNRYLEPAGFQKVDYAQGIKLQLAIGDRTLFFLSDGIYEWNELIGGWDVKYVTPPTDSMPYRWTYGYLNGYVFLCHPRTGILYWDLVNDVIQLLDVPGLPDSVIAICVDNGRLCCINKQIMAFSGPGNGFDWIPKLGGAGFQVISDRVSGDPMFITSFTEGVLTWTTGGVMRSAFTNDPEVYQHRALNTDYRLINPFCCVTTDRDSSIILDERGLFQTRGDQLEPFSPLFNEFLIEHIRKAKLDNKINIRLEWDNIRKLLFVMTGQNVYSPIYDKTYVLYQPLDQWGSFDEITYGILPIKIKSGPREDYQFGFIDQAGRVRYWLEIGTREQYPVDTTLDYIYPLIQKPSHKTDGSSGWTVSSSAKANTVSNTTGIVPAGHYPRDGRTKKPAAITGLDASISIGLMRFTGDMSSSQISEVTSLSIGNNISGASEFPSEDYLIDNTGEKVYVTIENTGYTISGYKILWATGEALDLLLDGQYEDFGLNPVNYVNHKLRLVGSIDGATPYLDTEPQVAIFEPGIRHFDASSVGIWFSLVFNATDPGEAFHIKSINMTAVDGGSLL